MRLVRLLGHSLKEPSISQIPIKENSPKYKSNRKKEGKVGFTRQLGSCRRARQLYPIPTLALELDDILSQNSRVNVTSCIDAAGDTLYADASGDKSQSTRLISFYNFMIGMK